VVCLQCRFLDTGQNRLDHEGRRQVGRSGVDQVLIRVVADGQGGASNISGIVPKAVPFTDPGKHSLSTGEVGFHPPHREGTEEEPPEVPILAVKQGCRGLHPCTSGHAPNEVLRINDGSSTATHRDPNKGRKFGPTDGLPTDYHGRPEGGVTRRPADDRPRRAAEERIAGVCATAVCPNLKREDDRWRPLPGPLGRALCGHKGVVSGKHATGQRGPTDDGFQHGPGVGTQCSHTGLVPARACPIPVARIFLAKAAERAETASRYPPAGDGLGESPPGLDHAKGCLPGFRRGSRLVGRGGHTVDTFTEVSETGAP
jgi:hypothetical protein